jgi:rhodanese-related sulfurtransferase
VNPARGIPSISPRDAAAATMGDDAPARDAVHGITDDAVHGKADSAVRHGVARGDGAGSSSRDGATAGANAPSTTAPIRPLIVDVREPGEFASERVAGAVLVPISQFVARHAELPRDRPLLMLCRSGSRSASATVYLLQAGWADVRNVDGGILAWMREGLPVRRGVPEPGEGDLPA